MSIMEYEHIYKLKLLATIENVLDEETEIIRKFLGVCCYVVDQVTTRPRMQSFVTPKMK